MESLTIGRVAKLAKVGIETIRFYEREGLVPAPPRRSSGYRQYPREAVDRVRFIKRAKELGFSLKEIGELLALRVEPGTTCGDIRKRAKAKIDDIEEKIRNLQRIKVALEELRSACRGRGPIRDCAILDAMEDRQ